jgi:DNA-binding transcriptional MerR regulator/methylmalonyl-CoA mutase cobalamin-binding subunit
MAADDSGSPKYPVRLVALRTGLTPHVLRAWERRYGVVSPTRTEGGQRLYSELDIERLRLLRRLTDGGHAIGRIGSLPVAELVRLDEEITREAESDGLAGESSGGDEGEQRRGGTVGESTAAAMRAIRRLDADEVQAVLEQAAATLGLPVFIDQVIAPTLARIGHGWAEGSLSVAEEHLATGVIRRVLGSLFRVYHSRGSAPRLVVATPPGQVHEFGALMVAISAAAEGWSVTYLGADLPVPDLVSAVAQTGARAIALSAVYLPEGVDLLTTLRELRAALPARVAVLVGGAATVPIVADAEAAGARVVGSLPELRVVLRRLGAEKAE